ncbi:MAG: hypothetical protein KDA42_05040 [Planctomycetales bacterium]|nr:hypothetical protein [Planctomycetales bacterium]
MSSLPAFQFVTCQQGAENVIKSAVAQQMPAWNFAYSRPGFLTFKAAEPMEAEAALIAQQTPFARSGGWTIDRIVAESAAERAAQFWAMAAELPFSAIHVWQRDHVAPDRSNFEPGNPAAAAEAVAAIAAAAPDSHAPWRDVAAFNRTAGRGQQVLDCILIDENSWCLGRHRADRIESRWPGGVPALERPEPMVSRAYLKMAEALAWSRLPLQAGDRCVEIGSAPGGASQCLLERGLWVMGIDPADMDPAIAAHPNFVHVRKRGADLKRSAYRSIRWLAADMNIVPAATLDIVEAIVTHRQVQIRGLLLTLKLRDWTLVDEIPAQLDRIRSWGYRDVRTRQLGYNRREICVAALKSRAQRRSPVRRKFSGSS